MDCRKLEFEEESFDMIVDKGTIDALLCSSNAFKNLAMTLKECQRVLKTNGVYIAISCETVRVVYRIVFFSL